MSEVMKPPSEQDLLEAAKVLEDYTLEGALRVAHFLRLLAPQMAMFANMMPRP